MVPKRSKTSGSDQPGTAAGQRRRPQTSSDVTSPPPASDLARTTEPDISSNTPAATGEDKTLRPLSAAEVAGAIEHERVELMQIQAMLKCLYEVLLYADDDDSVMHADVANVCARLIDDSVARLDKLLMRGGERAGSDEVDDSAVSDSCGSEEE
jgi:hypothetical protein